jgi:hypothetical protein
MGYLLFIRAVLRTAARQLLDRSQAIIFMLLILLGAASKFFPPVRVLAARVSTWETAIIVFSAII